MDRKKFLSEKPVGLILRVFAHEEDQIPARLEMVERAVQASQNAMVDGVPLIRRIDVLVWSDQRYTEADCGQTASALREACNKYRSKCPSVQVSEVRHADLYCSLLNYGVVHQLRRKMDYSIVASAEAFSYMTTETLGAMVDAACQGALAIGVAINELTDSILEGRIANTLAMWHNESLMSIGGFDLAAAKPPSDAKEYHFLVGYSPEMPGSENPGNVQYHITGVEEVIPLARMVENFGPCIAPIVPRGAGVQRYITPDPKTEPKLWQRHWAKMGTKLLRQEYLLGLIKKHVSYLEGGVMEAYRNQ